jgi:hypothetical protein
MPVDMPLISKPQPLGKGGKDRPFSARLLKIVVRLAETVSCVHQAFTANCPDVVLFRSLLSRPPS